MKYAKWWAVWLAVSALMYLAFFEHVLGAESVLKFGVWGAFIASFWSFSEEAVQFQARARPWPWPYPYLQAGMAWALLGVLVWFGNPVTGLAWAGTMGMSKIHRDMATKIRREQAPTE